MNRPRPRSRVQVRTLPRHGAGPAVSMVFGLLALAFCLLTRKGGTPGGLADTGNTIGLWTIIGVVGLVLIGLVFLIIGRRRRKQ